MVLIELILLILASILGVIVSITDSQHGKIRNKHLLLFGSIAILINSFNFFYLFAYHKASFSLFYFFIINLIISSLLAYLLYRFNIWSAGDGKLFFVFICLIPIGLFIKNSLLLTSLILLTNTFIIALLIILISLIKDLINLPARKIFIKQVFHIPFNKLWKIILSVFVVAWAIDVVMGLVSIDPGFTPRLVITFVLFRFLFKFFDKYSIVLMLLTVLRLLLDVNVLNLKFLSEFLIFVLTFQILNVFLFRFLDYCSFLVFTKKVKVKNICPSMIIVGKISKINPDFLNNKLTNLSIKSYVIARSGKSVYRFEEYTPFETGQFFYKLNKHDLILLKKFKLEKVSVAVTIPFAPLLFFGFALTIFLGVDLISFIRSFF